MSEAYIGYEVIGDVRGNLGVYASEELAQAHADRDGIACGDSYSDVAVRTIETTVAPSDELPEDHIVYAYPGTTGVPSPRHWLSATIHEWTPSHYATSVDAGLDDLDLDEASDGGWWLIRPDFGTATLADVLDLLPPEAHDQARRLDVEAGELWAEAQVRIDA